MALFQLQRLHSIQQDDKMILTCKEVSIWKEGVMADCKVLTQNLPGETEENIKI
jgi:hypothetical protein